MPKPSESAVRERGSVHALCAEPGPRQSRRTGFRGRMPHGAAPYRLPLARWPTSTRRRETSEWLARMPSASGAWSRPVRAATASALAHRSRADDTICAHNGPFAISGRFRPSARRQQFQAVPQCRVELGVRLELLERLGQGSSSISLPKPDSRSALKPAPAPASNRRSVTRHTEYRQCGAPRGLQSPYP